MEAPQFEEGELDSWLLAEPLRVKWRATLFAIQKTHYETAARLHRHRLLVGVPLILATAFVAAFTALGRQGTVWAPIAVIVLSLISAVLSALQTFLDFDNRAEKHRGGGAEFGALIRAIDLMGSLPIEKRPSSVTFMNSVMEQWNALTAKLPMVSDAVFERHQKRIDASKSMEEVRQEILTEKRKSLEYLDETRTIEVAMRNAEPQDGSTRT